MNEHTLCLFDVEIFQLTSHDLTIYAGYKLFKMMKVFSSFDGFHSLTYYMIMTEKIALQMFIKDLTYL